MQQLLVTPGMTSQYQLQSDGDCTFHGSRCKHLPFIRKWGPTGSIVVICAHLPRSGQVICAIIGFGIMAKEHLGGAQGVILFASCLCTRVGICRRSVRGVQVVMIRTRRRRRWRMTLPARTHGCCLASETTPAPSTTQIATWLYNTDKTKTNLEAEQPPL